MLCSVSWAMSQRVLDRVVLAPHSRSGWFNEEHTDQATVLGLPSESNLRQRKDPEASYLETQPSLAVC